ncbi:uncharacterized protein LOC125241810 [Leguminivora glycinivorella]|uniref:uncharacterized protein LOC125241810 n=1 Tax=Leguminivora glycinivorella TaxID=1035111 RepID=UPI00200F29F9|nr:uncharacterized protein LOC125241810 [Leguminivora glycinivorella]
MLAVYLPIFVSLAMAAPGISRTCYNYCNTKTSYPIKSIVPLDCNCEDFLDIAIESEESSKLTLDETGVYFVPADVRIILDKVHYKPFFISNPAKFLSKTRDRIYREFDSSKGAVNDLLPSQSTHIDIYEKKETISHTSINEESGNSPLYLDIEIQDSSNIDRIAEQKYTFINDFDTTEKALVKCLDFQVLHYTRQHGFMKEFQEFWEGRNLHKYEHLSDLDVEENIKTWCSEPATIVQNSLHEIKQGLPKKQPNSRAVNRITDNVNNIDNIIKPTKTIMPEFTEPEKTTLPCESSILYDNITESPKTSNKSTEENTSDTTYNGIENWTVMDINASSTLNKDNMDEYQHVTFPAAALSEVTSTTTEDPLSVDDSVEIKAISTLFTDNLDTTTSTPVDTENDLVTMGSEDIMHTYVYSPILTDKSDSNRLSDNDDDHYFNNTSLVHISTTPLSTEQTLGTESISDTDVFGEESLNLSVTDAYSELRSAYDEKEVKIPRIITKECQNNTIQTIIDGIEELPNNDFRDDESDITGRLYFVSNRELIPVRFVQTKGGSVNLGIDGTGLCDKIIRNTNKKSSLLTVLCEYIQSDMYRNKNP